MTKQVQIHKPTPTLHLPAHEHRAAAQRRHNAALPNIPNSGSTRPRNSRATQPRPVPTQLATHPAGYR